MRRRPLESLGALARAKRGAQTLREAGREIGVSAATLLRVESGRIPDVGTFGAICRWLGLEPGAFLGSRAETANPRGDSVGEQPIQISANFRADRMPEPETMKALAHMLMLAARTQPASDHRPDEHT